MRFQRTAKFAFFFTLLASLFFALHISAQPRRSRPRLLPPPTQKKTRPRLPPQTQPEITAPPVIPDMPFVHIVPYGTPKKKLLAAPLSSAGGRFQYYGGPVISNLHIVEVLWGSFVDAPSTTGLPQFLTDVPNSSYFDLFSEYGTVGVPGEGTSTGSSNQIIGRGVFDGKFTIAPSLCPGSASNPPCSISDSQIKSELLRQLPHLPAPVTDSQGNYNTMYLLYFPPGVHITLGKVSSCANQGFCAYHSSLLGSLPSEIPYGVFPDFGPTSGCSRGCGANTSANNLTSATSHELGEAVTDANVGNAFQFGPPLAWFSSTADEIGDVCNQDQRQITIGANTYTVQSQWSNMQGNCVVAPVQLGVTAPSSGAIPGKTFNITVTASPSTGGVLFNYNGTIHFSSSDPQAVLPADYTFVPNTDQGSHIFSVTLTTLGSQTVTATDTLAAPITATATINVSHQPDLTLSKSHTGNFTQGQTGQYTLIVANAGDIPTTGLVTVIDSLPFDLTVTAMSGTGWTCTLATVSCTRADALPANAAYPAITLTTKVANNAGWQILNIASASGGGESNVLNDQASDPTTVIVFPDLVPQLADTGNFSQGATGLQYMAYVQNSGQIQTTGAVALTVSLGTGITATAISGLGWNCVLATLHCTRSDTLPAYATYDPVQITVNIALNAAQTVNSSAVVSGGGEIITTNDRYTDATAIYGPVPDFAIVNSHTGNFRQGQSGATFRITVSNIGPVASTNPVTVNQYFDSGFALTSMSGTGWSCTLAQAFCMRSDALAAGASYPPITVTADVASSAPPTLNSLVNVYNVKELNAANNSAMDTANILGVPDVTAISQHQGSFGQTQIGATYYLTAVNIGAANSTGPITLTDLLPAGLTATAMSGNGWACNVATLTCTINNPISYLSPQITLTVNIAANAPSSVTNTVTVAGGGETNTTDNTSSETTAIAPSVALAVTGDGALVTAGHPASFGINVASFAPNPVVLACSGLPALAACSFTPPSVMGQGSTVLTITTAAPTRSAANLQKRNNIAPLYALLLPLIGLFLLWKPSLSTGAARKLGASAALLTLLIMAGCGGGGGSSTPPPTALHGGTPVGTYTITVTATDSADSVQGSTALTFSVNWSGL